MLNRVLLVALCLVFMIPGCNNGGPRSGTSGMKPGINYMQPMKWRVTYRYRIRDINPSVPYLRPRKWSIDPSIPAVGDGTCEVWMVGPREGEEVRDVNLIYAIPEPTSIERDLDGDVDLYYYDFTPDNSLPQEVQAAVQWEFITFERYAYWDGMPKLEWDKNSEIYKKYTAQEKPILWNKEMQKVAKGFRPKDPNDHFQTILNTYNYILNNFDYDHTQQLRVAYTGYQGMSDATRCWINKEGVCDEFSNVLCGLLRCNGIPCRPVAGWVHGVQQVGLDDAMLALGGHAWAEFYWPEVGWIPLDPTWGQGGTDTIEKFYSFLGNQRAIPTVDYYFGKSDPYRLTLFKDWNVKLNPPPKTPGANRTEMWFVGYTDRMSGIQDLEYGWEGIPGIGGG